MALLHPKAAIQVTSGKASLTLNTVLSTVRLITALPNMARCSPFHRRPRSLLRTTIRIMLPKPTSSSTEPSSLPNSLRSTPLPTDTTYPLSNRLMVALHSGQGHLSTALRSLEVAAVADSMALAVAMMLLSWALQFVWGLTTKSETIWLKRAVAFLLSIQIRVPLYHSPSPHIRAIPRKAFLSVRLTPMGILAREAEVV